MREGIRVIIKAPGKAPEEKVVPNTLESFQKLVDGFIETVLVEEDLIVVCDEEGRLKGKPLNCWFDGICFRGTIVVVGNDGEEFGDCPISLSEFREMCE